MAVWMLFSGLNRSTRKSINMRILFITVLILMIVVIIGLWIYEHKSSLPVPQNISQLVSFPIYYPDPNKLPKGYKLDVKSFSAPLKNGVTYTVNYGNDNKIVFSVQPKPSADELLTFDGNFLPLRTSYQTAVGQAEIGAYNLKTLVSLPTNSSSWIIITAPPNINQDQLKQVLSAITKD